MTRSIIISGMVFAAAMVIAACGGKRSTSNDDASATPEVQKDLPLGLDLRLSNGRAGAPAYDRSKVATTTVLDDAEVTALLARTKPLVPDPADKQAFAIRAGSQPPPRTGPTGRRDGGHRAVPDRGHRGHRA